MRISGKRIPVLALVLTMAVGATGASALTLSEMLTSGLDQQTIMLPNPVIFEPVTITPPNN